MEQRARKRKRKKMGNLQILQKTNFFRRKGINISNKGFIDWCRNIDFMPCAWNSTLRNKSLEWYIENCLAHWLFWGRRPRSNTFDSGCHKCNLCTLSYLPASICLTLFLISLGLHHYLTTFWNICQNICQSKFINT